MMILCYIPTSIDEKEIDRRVDLLLYKYDIFFIEDDDIITSTETNQKLLRVIIIHYKPILFWINSLKEIPFTPTEICELIIFILKNGCSFHSEEDNLYFEKGEIELVYPSIFEIFRKKKEYIPF